MIQHRKKTEAVCTRRSRQNRLTDWKSLPAAGSAARFFFCWVLLLALLLSCAAAGFCEGETQTEEESGQSVDPVRYPER